MNGFSGSTTQMTFLEISSSKGFSKGFSKGLSELISPAGVR
jgi:hypothetical protein